MPATFTVTNLLDDGSAGTFRWAVAQANAASGADDIAFTTGLAGTITLTSGELLVNDLSAGKTTINGPGSSILSVSGNNASRVFHLSTAADISGLTITGGNTVGGGVYVDRAVLANLSQVSITHNSAYVGAAIYNLGTLSIAQSTISSNSGSGAVVYNGADDSFATNSTITISDSTISNNAGDGVTNGIDRYTSGTSVAIIRSTISNNTGNGVTNSAPRYSGGGAVTIVQSTVANNTGTGVINTVGVASNAGAVTITDSTIANNADRGINNGAGGTVTIARSTIADNTSTLFGAGILNSTGSVTITQSTISGNKSAAYGGGGLFNSGGAVTITQSTIANNSAVGIGGGAMNQNDGVLAITQSTFAGNTASNSGGGLFNGGLEGNPGGTVSIKQSTFSGNRADNGGGLFNTRNMSLANTLVVGNIALNNPEIALAWTDAGGNVTGLPAGYTLGQVLQVDGNGNPLLASNGGPTQTIALVAGSPAIGRGVPIAGITTDQRGLPLQPIPASGAFALQSTTLPPAALPLAVSLPNGGGTLVKVLNPLNGAERWNVIPFVGFTGNVTVAMADVTGDGMADLIVGAGAGGGPHVKVFDGLSHTLISSFFAYDSGFLGGVNVAAGDVTGDGYADIITGAGPGAGPHVKVFDGRTGQVIRSFFAYADGFVGGVDVAARDVTGDGYADIVTGAGPGGGPHVKVFDGRFGQEVRSFFAYDSGFLGGVRVSAGDIDGDGFADVITGAGPSGGPHVKVFDARSGQTVRSFFAYDSGFLGGVRVATADGNGDGRLDLVTGVGIGAGPHVRVFDGQTLNEVWGGFVADPSVLGGVEVG